MFTSDDVFVGEMVYIVALPVYGVTRIARHKLSKFN